MSEIAEILYFIACHEEPLEPSSVKCHLGIWKNDNPPHRPAIQPVDLRASNNKCLWQYVCSLLLGFLFMIKERHEKLSFWFTGSLPAKAAELE